MEVPGHWGRVSELAEATTVRYRHRFNQQPPAAGERRWLVFEGLLYQADVWLNGSYLGDVEGYFMAHQFDVTEAMAGRREHLLAVELSCPSRSTDTSDNHMLGSLGQAPELLPPGNSGGLWAPVKVGRALARSASWICGVGHRKVPLIDGRWWPCKPNWMLPGPAWYGCTPQSARWSKPATTFWLPDSTTWSGGVEVPEPRRWWPHQLGDQPHYDVTVEVGTTQGGLSDRRRVRTGLRTVQMDQWQFSINGVRMFLKGASFGPCSPWWAEVDEADVRRDVELAKEAGLDLIRLYGHVAPPALYAAADEAGMMIWQDLPLVGPFPQGSRSVATDCARSAVGSVGAHPSVILWCGHVDPMGDSADRRSENFPGVARRLAAHQRPSWNLSVLDRSVKRELERRDPTRPVVAYSGVLPHLPRLDGTDTHLWLGWKEGHERDLEQFAARWPRAVRFVSQFGAQSPPRELPLLCPQTWPDLDWAGLARDHGLDAAAMNRHVPPRDHISLDEWQEAAWAYQAMLVRRHIETLRRLKYRPAGGFCQHFFADSHPAVSTSLVDWQRWPKPAYEAMAKACQPVIVVADRLPAELPAGDEIEISVHVVSDLHEPVVGLHVEATLEWPEGSQTWSWSGAVGTDECVRVGSLNWRVPDASGPAVLHLRLTGPVEATNRYDAVIFG